MGSTVVAGAPGRNDERAFRSGSAWRRMGRTRPGRRLVSGFVSHRGRRPGQVGEVDAGLGASGPSAARRQLLRLREPAVVSAFVSFGISPPTFWLDDAMILAAEYDSGERRSRIRRGHKDRNLSLALVTGNLRHFERIPGLTIERALADARGRS